MKFSRLRADVLAGLTTSFALLPECIAFALVAHLNPLMGLYGAFIICTITALFGGRPGMVSGAAGSMAVVIVALVVQHGVQYLLATVLLGGLIMLAFGLLRLGKLVRMVPHPVMLGFVNGLAIVIAMAQLDHFKDGDKWLSGTPLYLMIGLVALTMAIVYLLPRLTRAAPPALVAILSVGLAVHQVSRSLRLDPNEIKWRSHRGQRPWLAGTVIEHMCALLDVSELAELIASGAVKSMPGNTRS